jgi:hypothetical protein
LALGVFNGLETFVSRRPHVHTPHTNTRAGQHHFRKEGEGDHQKKQQKGDEPEWKGQK